MRPVLTLLAVLSCTLVVGSPREASAEPSDVDLAGARKLFEQGIHQEEAGDWAAALVTFRKVAAVRANHVVRFHVGLCLEKTGKLVAARDEFLVARGLAEKEDSPDAKKTVASATKHITALDARIPRIRVRRPEVGATLSIDGTLVGGLFDTQVPLDPGKHRIDVQAAGYEPYHAEVTTLEGELTPVEITPVLTKTKPSAPDKPTAVAEGDPRSSAPWFVVGTGAAVLVGAGVFYGLRSSALADVDASCAGARTSCDPALSDTAARGKTYTLVGNVLLGVGAATVVTGVGWLLLRPSAQRPVSIGVTAHLGGAWLVGRF